MEWCGCDAEKGNVCYRHVEPRPVTELGMHLERHGHFFSKDRITCLAKEQVPGEGQCYYVEGVDDVLEPQPDRLSDQFVFAHFPRCEPFTGIEEAAGCGRGLFRGDIQMFYDVS